MKRILIILIAYLFLSPSVNADSNSHLEFSKIYKRVESDNGEIYLLTNNGTWLVNEGVLTRVDAETRLVVNAKPYQALISKVYTESKDVWQKLIGVSYIILSVILALVYLYYNVSINKRRRSYYERMKVQQQVLSIAFLATGDEVLECDIEENSINRINKNGTIALPNEIYFQSEAFISSLHPDDTSIFLGHFKSLLHGGNNNYEIEYRISDNNDGWVWLVERGCVIERDDKGRAKRLVSSMRDISSIKQEHENLIQLIGELEKRLKASEAAFANH